jgi:hypothetical protein
MATLEDLQKMVLSLMDRVEQLERQLRSPAPQPKSAAPPPTYKPDLADNLEW